MKTASEMASWIAKTIENNSPETAAIIIMEEYNCNPYASHPSPMSAEQVFPSWEDATKGITDSRFTELPEKNTIRQGARIMYDMLYVMMKSASKHTTAMSTEQVEELADKHADKYYKKGSEEMIHIVEHLAWVNRKYNFIEGYEAATTPSVKADGLVNVKEKQRLEQIIELKEKERQEWANLCIKKEKILEGLIAGYCTVNEYMYDEYGKLILKEISETFLKNATKADRLSDTEVFQALGETILNFPLPSPPKQQL